jgi:hypothetical protein
MRVAPRPACIGIWLLTGALLSLSVAGMMSIGMFILPIAAAVGIIAARRTRTYAELSGLFVGAALPILWVAGTHLAIPPCAPGALQQRCTLTDPSVWLTLLWLGVAFAAAGALVYASSYLRR